MPLCFEVRINGGPPTIMGQADISVLSACLTFVSARSELEFRAGGLVSNGPHNNEYIEWCSKISKSVMKSQFELWTVIPCRYRLDANVRTQPLPSVKNERITDG